MTRKVLIINEGYSSNLGDQAIREATENFYTDKGYDTEFMYLSNPTLSELPNYSYLPTKNRFKKNISFSYRLKNYLYQVYWPIKHKKAIQAKLTQNAYDIISIGGGQLISSGTRGIISQFSTGLFWLTKWVSKLQPNASICFLAVGVHNRFSPVEKYYYKNALQKAKAIWVRDTLSKKVLKEIFCVESTEIPDIAYYNNKQNEQVDKQNLALVGVANYEEVVAKYLPSMTKDEYFDEILQQIKQLRSGYKTELFYTTVSDVVSTYEFQHFAKQQNINLTINETNNLQDLTKLLKMCKIVYTGRMHGLILGQKYGSQVIPFVLSPKLNSFKQKYIDSDYKISFDQVTIKNGNE